MPLRCAMTFSIVARSADGLGPRRRRGQQVPGGRRGRARGRGGCRARSRPSRTRTSPTGRRGWPCCAPGCPRPAWSPGLTAADDGRAQRQLGVVGAAGDGATFTGDGLPRLGGRRRRRRLRDPGQHPDRPEVVDAMRGRVAGATPASRAWPRGCSRRCGPATGPAATGAAGRARRCWWSPRAGVRRHRATSLVDLRVDDHPDPVAELARLLDLHDAAVRPARPGGAARPDRRARRRGARAAGRPRSPRRRPRRRAGRLGRRREPRGAHGAGPDRPAGARPAPQG